MTNERMDALWLDAHHEISFTQLAESSGASADELRELVEHGALAPTDPRSTEWTFTGNCVVTVRTARRLRSEGKAARLSHSAAGAGASPAAKRIVYRCAPLSGRPWSSARAIG